MALRIGIGIVTYNRKNVLAETLGRVRAHTKLQSTLVVADDGSDDGTLDFVRSQGITVVTGRNRGVAWNKNRALFLKIPFSAGMSARSAAASHGMPCCMADMWTRVFGDLARSTWNTPVASSVPATAAPMKTSMAKWCRFTSC